jgi:hypothetical protein
MYSDESLPVVTGLPVFSVHHRVGKRRARSGRLRELTFVYHDDERISVSERSSA